MPDTLRQDPGPGDRPAFGFPRDLRLTDARDFSKVFKGAQARHSFPGLLVLLRKNGLPRPRLGMAIARKHVPRANARNRIKRLVRESFRRNQLQLIGWDVVIVSRAGLAGVSITTINDKLLQTWQKIKPCYAP